MTAQATPSLPTFRTTVDASTNTQSFVCPSCNAKITHGMSDGHRVSHCDCWPHGYILQAGENPDDLEPDYEAIYLERMEDEAIDQQIEDEAITRAEQAHEDAEIDRQIEEAQIARCEREPGHDHNGPV